MVPSHVAGKADKSDGAAARARLPGVCLILPLHEEEALLFFLTFIAGRPRGDSPRGLTLVS